ncbi:pentapeptide repeat-containing protein [Faecalicatena sp.]|uniref:pentapeptide repeat-containing protein n=1 Tax=Faecalicatena sp. TaxID=2005360 RepID=UPI002ED49699
MKEKGPSEREGHRMQELSKEELMERVQLHRLSGSAEKRLDLQDIVLRDMDLSGADLKQIDFSRSSFYHVRLDRANLSGSVLNNTWFEGCTLRGADLKKADLTSSALRGADMRDCDIRGANLFCAVLEKANLEGCILDEDTRFFRLYCPESGAFIGYKKCCDDRIVELLIPADAKRTSATRNSCRCSKAKVLVIKSFDCSEYFQEAWSIVDENFVYRTGEWVEVPDFDEDRWNDSTTGIHFWMTREDAIQY